MANIVFSISIRASHFDLTEPIKTYIEEKIGVLAKYLPHTAESASVDVRVARTTYHHKQGPVYRVTALLSYNGETLHAEVEEEDVYAGVDRLHDELQRELTSQKEREISIGRRGARIAKKFLRLSKLARFWRRGRIREEGE